MSDTPSSFSPAPRQFQFGFWTLAEVFVGLGLAFALVAELRILGLFVLVLAVGAAVALLYAARARSVESALQRFLAIGGAMLCVFCLLLPLESSSREGARRNHCGNTLKRIAIALYAYHDKFGQFPPAAVYDNSSRPIHSWRTLILPQLGHQRIFDAYRMDEPWDSTHNRQVARDALPELNDLNCPSSRYPNGQFPLTTYCYIVGPGRTNERSELPTLQQLDAADGAGNTLLVVESDAVSVDWFEPRDLTMEWAQTGYVRTPQRFAGSLHRVRDARHVPHEAFHAAFADGSVRLLRASMDVSTLKALCSVDGGERIDWSQAIMPDRTLAIAWLIILTICFVGFVVWRRWPRRQPTATA